MLDLFRGPVGELEFVVVATDAADGDMRPDRADSMRDPAWVMVDEEHGVEVFDADAGAGSPPVGTLPIGDVIVTRRADVPVAIWAGDCAPVVLCGADGTLVAVHAGWKGLAAGVLDVAVGALRSRGDRVAAAVLGPCIHPECYEFGPNELAAVAAGLGVEVASITGRTAGGGTALDVPAAVAAGLARHGVTLDVVGACTACDRRWFSHRSRRDEARHAVVAWTVPGSERSG